jgi:hypothetical protein
MANILMQFIAKNPPSILLLGAVLLYLIGNTETANVLLVGGIFLQVLWLVLRRR